ncbi:MAG: M3 family oligoendopeptidase [Pseudomonadota bacterium]
MTHPIPRDHRDGAGTDLGVLPVWDLTDLYDSPDDPKLEADLARLGTEAERFAAAYRGRLSGLSAAEMVQALAELEARTRVETRVMSYADLLYAQNTSDPERGKFYTDIQAKLTDLSSELVFFDLEINRIPDDVLEAWLKEDTALARYRPLFERIRAMKPFQLSDELERLLHDQSVIRGAWMTLFDETMAGLTFEVGDKTLGLEATLNLLTEHERPTRETAARAVAKVLSARQPLFARITNTLAKDKEITDRWRGMPTPQTGRHLANQVEPEVVEALRTAVVEAYPDLSHRYYALKARWLGLERLEVWDRSAPLPTEDKRIVPWAEARDIVLDAYGEFDPLMARLGTPFFERGWIDAGATPGKSPGAFAHPTATDAHPYLLLNYLGKQRDVMTLAHELGHGVHQVLAAEQGELLARTPLTLAETASVFGEMLTFKRLLAGTTDPGARKALLASKVEDMIATVVRQISFYDFECKVHAARREGELTPDQLNAIWMEVSRESLGPTFDFMEGYETFWSYIPHFIHAPFYVYAYAFGDGLVNALYAVYEEGAPGFQSKYFEMLSAGGSKHHKALLAPFGLDASDPRFWDKGLSVIGDLITELEELE